MRLTILFAFLAMISLTSLRMDNPHAFYVSITELEVKNDTLQISLRLFTEDLERALNERTNEKVFLNEPQEMPKNFVHIRDYVAKNFIVSNAAKPDRITWLGHEFEEDVCWIYGEVALSPEQNLLFIKNELLMDIHDRQQNIIHFNTSGGIETKLATKGYAEVRFALK
ncbi:MAG: hypothetical protein HQ500_07155 [Flavobacteriales bacterium]|nr:hypothetical protein [Flavobacteriales bacterium]